MTDESEEYFLLAMQEHPEDDSLPLVFADWLEERGDPRSELLRLLHTLTQAIEVPQRTMLEDYLRSLLAAGVQPVGPFFTNSIGMRFAMIPAGKFVMGSPKDEKDRFPHEEQHEVAITKPFYIGLYTVTQAEYQKVMGDNPSYISATGEGRDAVKAMDTSHFPVERVSWDDAVAFCKKLSDVPEEKNAGRVYRLPTEAEYEYACRAGTKTVFYYSDSLSSKQANFNGNEPYGGADKGPYLGRTVKVGTYAPNAFGLYDMHGNVWQWCQDYYDVTSNLNMPGSTHVDNAPRVVRGGNWNEAGGRCRSSIRGGVDPGYGGGDSGNRYGMVGFRVAADQSGPEARWEGAEPAHKALLALINSVCSLPERGTMNRNGKRENDLPNFSGTMSHARTRLRRNHSCQLFDRPSQSRPDHRGAPANHT